MVEDVVEFGAELNLQTIHRRVELLVQVEVGFVELGRAARVPRGIAEGAQQVSIGVFGSGERECIQVDVLNAAVGSAALSQAGVP